MHTIDVRTHICVNLHKQNLMKSCIENKYCLLVADCRSIESMPGNWPAFNSLHPQTLSWFEINLELSNLSYGIHCELSPAKNDDLVIACSLRC